MGNHVNTWFSCQQNCRPVIKGTETLESTKTTYQFQLRRQSIARPSGHQLHHTPSPLPPIAGEASLFQDTTASPCLETPHWLCMSSPPTTPYSPARHSNARRQPYGSLAPRFLHEFASLCRSMSRQWAADQYDV